MEAQFLKNETHWDRKLSASLQKGEINIANGTLEGMLIIFYNTRIPIN